MRLLLAKLHLAFWLSALVILADFAFSPRFGELSQDEGELRCEGAGAVIINIAGTDYAVNGLAGGRYPPVRKVWPDSNVDRLIVRGLSLCDWETASTK